MKQRFWIAVGCLSISTLFAGTACGAQTFYVSPDGNDAWSGKQPKLNSAKSDGPFASIQKALESSRGATARPAKIELRGGNYFLSQPIVLTPADSEVTIATYNNEKPVVSGGQPIKGWKAGNLNNRSVWEASLPEVHTNNWNFRELWINGKRAVRARHPNKGYLKVAELPDKTVDWFQGHQRFRFAEGDLQSWKGIKGAEVLVMNRWVESRLPVASLDEKEQLIAFTKRSVFQLAPGDLYYLEGAMEALDQPGEWYLDSTAGKLYYLPRPGETLDRIEAIAPVLPQVLRFEGSAEKGQAGLVRGVKFSGVTFSHTEWCFPSGFDSSKGAVEVEPAPKAEVGGFAQAAVGVPGAVWGRGVHDCLFEHCRFINLGTYGLELTHGCIGNKILGCEFNDLGAGGIKIGETKIPTNSADETRGNEISDCTVADGGKMFPSAIGVWIGQSPDNRITHNHIHDFYYTGISIGWTWGYGPAFATNQLVAFNHVHHLGAKSDGDGPILSDMGGIYTLGMQPGTLVLNNLWHDIAGLQYGGWGIYFDEGSSSIIARSNIVYHTTHGGFHQHYGATNHVENNIFALARDQQIQRSRQESHVSFLFTTNLVYFDHGALLGSSWSDDKFMIDWNVYWDTRLANAAATMKFGEASPEQWHGRGHDQNSIIADPLFVDPAQNNFQLQKTSPALKLGFHAIDLTTVGPRKNK